MKKLLVLIMLGLAGCVPYHYTKSVSIVVHFTNVEQINQKHRSVGGKKRISGLSFPNKNPCEIWVERGDTFVLGHEVEHCLGEISDDQ